MTNDDLSEETEFFGFKISAPQGADLRGQRSEDVADVGLLDDDPRGVTIGPTSISLDEPASGETAVAGAYTVNLNSKPADTVTVTIGGSTPAVSLSGHSLTNNQLTFTTTNWNTAQTITVTPVKDDNAVGETITLTHTLSGGDYAGIAADSVTVNLIDSDTRNMVLSKQSLTVTEEDATGDRYTVKLATQPSDTVIVTISGHDGTDLSLDKTSLTFTVDDCDVAQTVMVEAGQDNDGANDTPTLTHTASGGDYASVSNTLPVTVTDDDAADIVLSETDLTVTEGDAAGTSYTVKLATRPSDTVIVTISGHDGTDLSLDKTNLTFTVDDWDVAQTVTVEAGQDNDGSADTATLTHTASGGDYASVSNTLPVTVTDDDAADIVLSETDLTLTEGDAAGSTYTVSLATRPSDTVIVTISGHEGTDLSLDKTSLTFTVDNWATAQTVMVEAGQDNDGANDTATLTHTASGGDYASITADLPVTVTDDDDPQVTVSFGADAYTVLEGDTQSVTVTLSADPERTVVIPLAATDQGDATSADYSVPLSVTFDAGDMSKTITFSATDDTEDDDGESVLLGFGTTLPSGVSAGTPATTTVSIGDDDDPQVTVSFDADAYTVAEGGTQSVTVTLSADPERTVIIPLVATNKGGATSADYSGVPASVTFNAGETSTLFTFMATQDDMDEDCECVLLAFGALPSGVSEGPTPTATVSIADIATTPEGTPTVPPAPTSLTAYGEDQSLYVRWEIPAGEDARASVTSYLVRYRQVGASSWRNVSRINVGSSVRKEDITGLTNRRAYEVQVAAVNRMGTGAWASVKGTPQAPYAVPPGPEGDEAFELGRLSIYWLDPDADQTNVLQRESCTGSEGFRAFWTGPDGNRRADDWAVHINTRRGAGEVSYSFDESSGTPDGPYFSMNGTVNFEGDGALSLSERGRFGQPGALGGRPRYRFTAMNRRPRPIHVSYRCSSKLWRRLRPKAGRASTESRRSGRRCRPTPRTLRTPTASRTLSSNTSGWRKTRISPEPPAPPTPQCPETWARPSG